MVKPRPSAPMIRLKLVAALVAGLAAIALATAVLMKFVHERAVGLAAEREVALGAAALADLQALEVDRMSALLEAIVANERFAARFAARDREGLLAQALPLLEILRERHGVTHWYFHPADPRGDGVFLRVHRPELFGDSVRRDVVRRAVASRRQQSGVELGRTAFALRVVRPWFQGDRLLGYLELAEDVPTFLERLQAMTGDDYELLLAKERLDRGSWAAVTGDDARWDERPELLAVASTARGRGIAGDVGRLTEIPDGPTVLGERAEGDRVLVRGAFPLRDGDGVKIGAVVVVHDVTALHAGVSEVRVRVVLLVALLAAGLAALVVFLLESLVFGRLERMARLLEDLPERLARGEAELGEVGPQREDEIGRFERFLRRALRELGSFVSDARRDEARRDGGDAR